MKLRRKNVRALEAYLNEHGPSRLRDIAEAFGMRRGTVQAYLRAHPDLFKVTGRGSASRWDLKIGSSS